MNLLCYPALSAAVMLGLPWLAVTFAPSDTGMAICFILFFAVDPIYAIWIGIHSGKDSRKLWCQPLVTAVCFLLGVWLLFEMGEPDFLRYALVYLVLGYLSMAVTALIMRRKQP